MFIYLCFRNLNMSPYFGQNSHDCEAVYDLYSVINHHGDILGGHYTAYGCCAKGDGTAGHDVG